MIAVFCLRKRLTMRQAAHPATRTPDNSGVTGRSCRSRVAKRTQCALGRSFAGSVRWCDAARRMAWLKLARWAGDRPTAKSTTASSTVLWARTFSSRAWANRRFAAAGSKFSAATASDRGRRRCRRRTPGKNRRQAREEKQPWIALERRPDRASNRQRLLDIADHGRVQIMR